MAKALVIVCPVPAIDKSQNKREFYEDMLKLRAALASGPLGFCCPIHVPQCIPGSRRRGPHSPTAESHCVK